MLNAKFTEKDVFLAVKKMNPTKAPGIDGLPAIFYQRFWDTLKGDVVRICLKVLNENADLRGINKTLVVLIPKDEKPDKVENFRLISLCNVIYKIISKCLANRLRDDILVFLEANKEECSCFLEVLRRYASASGHEINLSKSEMFFGKIVSTNTKLNLSRLMRVRVVQNFGNYLGLPTFMSRKKMELFMTIKDKVWHKLRGWKTTLFSAAGREVLIKVVIQTMPTYLMSYFKIPRAILDKIHGMVARFWWGSSEKKKKIHWCK
ncbi:uncharacterized protein LOC141696400 [Apium graveolens]|uniref:uncharacterized protein LOC141696400 n=1 Tax=Apium graveolens TaxID=4045 RepID=UPI003D7A8281